MTRRTAARSRAASRPATARAEVLFGIDIDVGAGEVVGAAGPQRHGQETLLRAIWACCAPRAGSVRFAGAPIARPAARPRSRARGMAIVPEGPADVPEPERRRAPRAFARRAATASRAWTPARSTSCSRAWPNAAATGQPALRRRAADAGDRPRAVTNPRLLILDEATEGLAPLVREEIWRCLAQLHGEGEAMLVIDKYVQRLLPSPTARHPREGPGGVARHRARTRCRPRRVAAIAGRLSSGNADCAVRRPGRTADGRTAERLSG